jgi:CubicO group peptidase (beta-lactamase class C family)
MQDYDPRNCRYVGGPDSVYPAYVFFLSARDLARFGLLYLHHGRWGDHQIIPSQWIDDGTKVYSATNVGSGYGYLWWTSFPNHSLAFPQGQGSTVARSAVYLPPGSYFAWGNGGQFVFIIPSDDLIIVHLARMGAEADDSHKNGVELGQMASLLAIILEAANGH